MTLDQFRQLAEIWGGDVDRWPAVTRDAARDIGATIEGLTILDEQRRLDRLLASAPEVSDARAGQAGFAVLQRIARSSNRQSWYRRLPQPTSLFPAASLACSVLVGVWLAGSHPYQHQEEGIAVVSMVFDSSALTLWGVQ